MSRYINPLVISPLKLPPIYIGSAVRVSVTFEKIPRLVGRIGSGLVGGLA